MELAAAVTPEPSLPEGEGTPVAEPEDGARHHLARGRTLARTVGSFVVRACRAARERNARTLDLEKLLGFALVADRDLPGNAEWEEPLTLDAPPGEEGGAVSRFSASILRTTARYRHVATPTVEIDSDTGTLLVGLTWRR